MAVATNKYDRTIHDKFDRSKSVTVDVYEVLDAFGEPPAPVAHAVKKLLCAGLRGKGDERQDLTEAIQAIQRRIDQLQPAKAGSSVDRNASLMLGRHSQ